MGVLERDHMHVTCVPTMTEMEKSPLLWDGERGFIDQQRLAKHLPRVVAAT